MSLLKKEIFLESETVETVIRIGLYIINPRLKSGVNNKLSDIITVSTVSKIFISCLIHFEFQPFLSRLKYFFKKYFHQHTITSFLHQRIPVSLFLSGTAEFTGCFQQFQQSETQRDLALFAVQIG